MESFHLLFPGTRYIIARIKGILDNRDTRRYAELRKTVLFIAMSLDGYIADINGGTGWLEGQEPGGNDLVSYEEFVQDVDTVVMGANTYRRIVTELSPGEWAYPDLTSYIITHTLKQSTDGIRFTDESPCQLVNRLRGEAGKDIWICGGASVVGQLTREDLIDRYYINVIPVILGNGIRLFAPSGKGRKLKLIRTRSYNGITDLVYERR